MLIRHLWQLETAVFLHWCSICAVLLRDLNREERDIDRVERDVGEGSERE